MACARCDQLLADLDYATRALAALTAQLLATRKPLASASCLLCAEKWRVLAERGEDTCPGPDSHCASVECKCPCHDLTRPPAAAPLAPADVEAVA